MKAEERRGLERRVAIYRGLLKGVNDIGPTSDSPDDLAAYGEVKDYILDRIDEWQAILEKPVFSGRKKNSLPARKNTPDNALSSGEQNA